MLLEIKFLSRSSIVGSIRIPQYPIMNAIAGPQTISNSKCIITGGRKNSAAIQPTRQASPKSFHEILFCTAQFVIPPQPEARTQQVFAPIAIMRASIEISSLLQDIKRFSTSTTRCYIWIVYMQNRTEDIFLIVYLHTNQMH